MPELHITPSMGKNFTHVISEPTLTIGRSDDNTVVLADHTASRKHTRLVKTAKGYMIEDLGSHNGTFVNGSRVRDRLLRHKDLIKIGTSILTFLDKPTDPGLWPHPGGPPTPIPEPRGPKTPEIGSLTVNEDDASDQAVVAAIESKGVVVEDALLTPIEPKHRRTGSLNLVDLEKTNKTLYVLYQISRKLSRLTDFDELLTTIMDLIFQVIDADYGFVALVGPKLEDIIPKVIKYRTAPDNKDQELKISRTIISKVVGEKTSILTSNAMTDDRFDEAKSIFLQNIRSVLSVPLWRGDDVIGLIQVDGYRLSNTFTKADLDLLTTISHQMAMVIEQANLNEQIKQQEEARQRLERFHSPEVVNFIISGDQDEETLMAPTEKYVTMLFTDIVNFTPLSERFPPAEISQLLNLYFAEMTDIIFDYNGTLDKYIGDAIMAVFGAPIERENDAERAIWAALEMRRRLFQLMKAVESDRRFDIRLGINSGKVVAGNMGSPRRMEYTVIGDTVNVAARLESIADPNQILIGEGTWQLVRNKFNIHEIGLRSVKGKKEPIRVFEVRD